MFSHYRPLFLVLVVVASISIIGCGKINSDNGKNNVSVPVNTGSKQDSGQKTITTSAELISTYQEWVSRLDTLATKTKQAYQPWATGQVPVETYLEQTRALYEEMKTLNMETDLKTDIQLSKTKPVEAERAQAIVAAYQKASKDLNDFLVTSNTRGDDEIKAKFKELIEQKYTADLKELQGLLDQSH